MYERKRQALPSVASSDGPAIRSNVESNFHLENLMLFERDSAVYFTLFNAAHL